MDLSNIGKNSIVLTLIITAFFIFLFTFWYQQRKISKKDEIIFDMAIVGTLLSILFARTIGFLSNLADYTELFWSFNFLTDDTGTLDVLGTMPWAFFKFWDGNIYFPALAFGVILVIWLQARTRRSVDEVRATIDNATSSIIVPFILMLITGFVGGFYTGKEFDKFSVTFDGVSRFPLNFIQSGVLLLILLIVFVSKREKKGQLTAFFLLINGIAEFALRYFAAGYKPVFLSLDAGHLFALIIILVSVVFFLSANQVSKGDGLRRVTLADSTEEDQESRTFNVSYSRGSDGKKVRSGFLSNIGIWARGRGSKKN